MIIGQFCETYPPALDGVGRVMLAYCQTLSRLGHRCLYIAPQDAANTPTPEVETLRYPGLGIPGEPYRVGERARQTIPIPWADLMERVLARYRRLIDRHAERSPA